SRTSNRFATALARATSTACAAMRRISSSVTSGLLAKPHTPLCSTRTPKPALSLRPPPPPNPKPPSVTMRSRTLTESFTLRVKRMSQYEAPMRFASPSATSDRPLNFEASARPLDWARRSATRSLAASATVVAPAPLRKSRRFHAMADPSRSDGRRDRGHREVLDLHRGHHGRAGLVVGLARVHRHGRPERADVVEADHRRLVPAEVLHGL